MSKSIGSIIFASLLTVPCFGTIIATDDFTGYTTGSTLSGNSGGSGWLNNWSSVATTTVESGVVTGYGNGVQVTANNNNNLVRQFTAQSGTFYAGMVIQTNSSFVLGTNFIQFYFSDAAGDSNTAALGGGIRNTGGGDYFTRIGGTGNNNNSADDHVNSQNVSLVFKLSKVAASNYNRVELFVNQATEGTANTTYNGSSSEGSIDYFHLRTAVWSAGAELYLDNLTIATTYAEAYTSPIPEPSALLLTGLGSLALLRRRR